MLFQQPVELCSVDVMAVEWSMYQMPGTNAAYFSQERMELRAFMLSPPCNVTVRKWF